MRDRKLLDQTLPLKEAGTLVSPSRPFSRSCGGKVKKIVRLTVDDGSVVMGLFQSVPSRQVFGGRPPRNGRSGHLPRRKKRQPAFLVKRISYLANKERDFVLRFTRYEPRL